MSFKNKNFSINADNTFNPNIHSRNMHLLQNYLLLAVIFAIDLKTAYSDDTFQFIESLRREVRNLEAAGKINRNYEPYEQPEIKDEETYDFIIVGGGSAGSALVHRLTEVSKWKILLLEAGGEPDIISDIPLWSPALLQTRMNWNYTAEKEDNIALGMEGGRINWPRGKVLGGSSMVNFVTYTRCAKEDYDMWAKLGNPGWSYKDLLPYFKKMESCHIETDDQDVRGDDGPISVEYGYKSKYAKTFVEAAEKLGYKYIDYNGERRIGVSYVQANLKKGLRCSGESCYIRPIKNRKNLTIRLNSLVTKILIENKQARGVEFELNEKTYKAYAAKEVILSAGVINSAQILLLSGIGPAEQLSNFGIEPIQDLPVGQKIYDHQLYVGLGFALRKAQRKVYNESEIFKPELLEELFNKGTGILSSPNKVEALAFGRTDLTSGNAPDFEIILMLSHYCQEPGFRKLTNLANKIYESTCESYKDVQLLSPVISLLHPESFGYLELASASPRVHPKIYPRYFTDAEGKDMKTMIRAIRKTMKIFLSAPFQKYGIETIEVALPACKDFEKDSDQYWECSVRHLASTMFHPTTSCKMGSASDAEAVVDNRLRVYGMKKLRVADASVIPVQLAGHTNVPTMLVGEKAADLIKEEYLNRDEL